MNKKYLPSALILYLNYFIHGVGCSILGQAVIKEALAAAWGVEAMAITAISAALGLGPVSYTHLAFPAYGTGRSTEKRRTVVPDHRPYLC